MTRPFDNQPIAGDNPFYWDEFDALPDRVRSFIAHAPVELGSHRAWVHTVNGRNIAFILEQERRVSRAACAEILRRFYPPVHPRLQGLLA